MRKYSFLLILFCTISFIHPQGKKFINFKLQGVESKSLELKSFIGKGPVLLSFWATWCKPCMEEMTELNKLKNEFGDKLNVLSISVDDEKTISKVKPYIKSKNYNLIYLYDSNSEILKKYGGQNVPYTVLIDNKGNIVFSHSGYMKGDENELKKQIKPLVQ